MRVRLEILAISFCAALGGALPAEAVPAHTNAALPEKNAASPAKNAVRTVKAWKVEQSSNWGNSIVKACDAGIRIESNTGSILVAKPPEWTVVIYRPGQKLASKNSYARFITKYPRNTRMEKFHYNYLKIKMAGAPARQYTLPLNRRLDPNDGFGHTFQAKLEVPFVKDQVMTIADDSIKLPAQVKEIWRQYFEFPLIERVPLEYYMLLGNGTKRYQFQTSAQKYVDVPVSEFDFPPGLQYSKEFMQMIYGKQLEDAADLFVGP